MGGRPASASYAWPVATRVIAIDWSGRRDLNSQRSAIFLAEASPRGLVRLESGRTRDEIVEHLVAEAGRDPDLVVGLDFAFSLPGWYLRRKRLDALALRRRLADEALTPRMKGLGLASWLTDPDLPFWTRAGGRAFLPVDQQFRRTELELRALGLHPKSAFQLVGAGQVGRGSLYGMQALGRLTAGRFHAWPFDDARRPLLVEIYPRALARNVTRSRPAEMRDHLEETGVRADFVDHAAANEHAFDAAVSALVMAAHLDELLEAPPTTGYELEGKIWLPRLFPNAPAPRRIRRAKAGVGGGRRLVVAPDLYPPPDYAHASLVAGQELVHTAGAVPLDAEGKLVGAGDFAEQARQTLANLTAALAAVGARPEDVVKTTVYVVASEQAELAQVWDVVRRSELAGVPSTLLGVSLLGYAGQLVEIEAVAVLASRRRSGQCAAGDLR